MKLSNQAKWYFYGSWPVFAKAPVGYKDPEPKAMQELVDAGLAERVGKYWKLTAIGIQEAAK